MRPAATTRPTITPGRIEEIAPELDRLWQLILLDDNDHTYDYVIEMLGAVFGYSTEKAFALARIVDTQGRVTLMTATHDACEAKQTAVHAYGADPRLPQSKGSMSAVLERLD
ncbi:MAG: ATP-dependent Clp protease adaptor ClpS [Dehalococcoidia bacterium]